MNLLRLRWLFSFLCLLLACPGCTLLADDDDSASVGTDDDDDDSAAAGDDDSEAGDDDSEPGDDDDSAQGGANGDDDSQPCVDADGDNWCAGEDCDDANAQVNPVAVEICDEADNDCNGLIDDQAVDQQTWFMDVDNDGYGAAHLSTEACEAPAGHVADDSDCDDLDPAVNPGATELCDEIDNDCNELIDESGDAPSTWFIDTDGDGYGNSQVSTQSCEAPAGYVANDSDCDDLAATTYPGATETCDEADNNCDGQIDEGTAAANSWFADSDADGYGNPAALVVACSAPAGFVADSSDCDDLDSQNNPLATEICDEADNNCDGQVDEGAAAPGLWYADYDGDSFGNTGLSSVACLVPLGFTSASGDCDDLDATSYPGAAELCDGVDNNCDAAIDEGVTSTFFADSDNDGFGDPGSPVQACLQPAGTSANGLDCDDSAANAHPGGVEVCDSIDNDCSGFADDGALDALTWYLDSDGDGYGAPGTAQVSCTAIAGSVSNDSDCNDGNNGNYPGNSESCDGLDEDCDGVVDNGLDADGDGTTGCGADGQFGTNDDDCDDTDPGNFPGNSESCDGLDENCDGVADNGLDADGDGVTPCGPDGIPGTNDDDCDDGDPTISPGATETWYDGIDSDCDGGTDYDQDGDGYLSDNHGGDDCDDTNGGVNPGATEVTGDGIDSDCDGNDCDPSSGVTIIVEGVSGNIEVCTSCNAGAYSCQAQQICDQLTNETCVHQNYDCHNGNRGSWYPPSQGGGSNFNFAYDYDFEGGGNNYGNICDCSGVSGTYGIGSAHQNCGTGHWFRQ